MDAELAMRLSWTSAPEAPDEGRLRGCGYALMSTATNRSRMLSPDRRVSDCTRFNALGNNPDPSDDDIDSVHMRRRGLFEAPDPTFDHRTSI